MKKCRILSLVLVLMVSLMIGVVVSFALPATSSDLGKADLVLLDGKVITVNSNFDIEEAVAVKGNKIVAVGSTKEIRPLIGPETRVIDLNGRSVGPGFNDSHIHFLSLAMELGEVDVSSGVAPNMDLFLEKVKERVQDVQEMPKDAWIFGGGWDQTGMDWTGKWDRKYKNPTRWDLDKVLPNNPVYLSQYSGHMVVVNSKALELAGITKDTPQPKTGVIDKITAEQAKEIPGAEAGEPTGVLREEAMDLVRDVMPERKVINGDLQEMFEKALSVGLTSIQGACVDKYGFALYQEALKKGELPIRVSIWLDNDLLDEAVELGISSPFGNKWLKITGIKFFADGALSTRSAALREPYSDEPGASGILEHDVEDLTKKYTKAHKAGLKCATHAIGDLGIEVVLEANRKSYEKLGLEPGKYRDSIEHSSVLGPDLIEEYAKQNMIASIQLSFAVTDHSFAGSRLGPERMEWLHVWNTLLEHGVRLAGGTDAPVETYRPLTGIEEAVTRRGERPWMDLEEVPEDGFLPQEALSVMEAIKLYTLDSAYAQFSENYLGSIEVGKLGDLVVLSGDILTVPHNQIANLKVDMTIIDGKVVYSR